MSRDTPSPSALPTCTAAGVSGRAPGSSVVVAIRVSPSSSRTAVGGRRGDALVVRVTEAAVDGRATEAALRALAQALDVPRRAVSLHVGASSRDKLVDVFDQSGDVAERVAALLGQVSGSTKASFRH